MVGLDKETRPNYSVVYKEPTWIIKVRICHNEEIERALYANSNQKKIVVAILISEKSDFRKNKIIGDKEGHYVAMKDLILQEDIIILNMDALSNGASPYTRQKWRELPEEIEKSTVWLEAFTPLFQ